MAVLYGRDDALAELPGPNHFFVTREEGPYYFEPGGPSHEGCAGLLALGDYLKLVAGAEPKASCDRAIVERAFGRFAGWEEPLLERLLAYLRDRRDVRIIGPDQVGPERVGTVSFVHAHRSSAEIAAAIQAENIAIRHGHMYAWHLCEAVGLDPADGVVRVSFVHYNTPREMDRLIEALEKVL
jgi:selenocysteine lyase/cysteine desulfurase